MVNRTLTLGFTMLLCLTPLPLQSLNCAPSIKAIGLGSAFGIILPATIGVGMHFLERSINIEHRGSWREEEYLKIEASKLLQTAAISIVSTMTWSVLNGFCSHDFRIALSLISIYCYGQGRSLYMSRQSKLQKSSSYLLPGALGIIAYTRITDLAPQLELAGKSLLVFGLAHICA